MNEFTANLPKITISKTWRNVGIGLAMAAVLAVLNPFRSVPAGYRGVVTQFGEYIGLREEGLAFVWPHQDLQVFSVRAEFVKLDKVSAASTDSQAVTASLTVRYAVMPNQVAMVYREFSRTGDISDYVETAAQESFKAATAGFTATDLIRQREVVSAKFKSILENKLKVYGARVIATDTTNFEFSANYKAAIDRKTTEDQNAQAAEAALRTTTAIEQKKVLAATAAAQVSKAEADAAAYSVTTRAAADAKALELMNQAIANNKDVLELKRIQVLQTRANRWNGVEVPNQFYGSAPIPLSSVTGAR
jgi:prohibitin 2